MVVGLRNQYSLFVPLLVQLVELVGLLAWLPLVEEAQVVSRVEEVLLLVLLELGPGLYLDLVAVFCLAL